MQGTCSPVSAARDRDAAGLIRAVRNPPRDGEETARLRHDGVVHELVIHPDRGEPLAFGLLERGNDLRRPRKSIRRRRERLVHDGNLVRMDAQAPLVTKRMRHPHRCPEAVDILQANPDGIDRGIQPRCARGKRDGCASRAAGYVCRWRRRGGVISRWGWGCWR